MHEQIFIQALKKGEIVSREADTRKFAKLLSYIVKSYGDAPLSLQELKQLTNGRLFIEQQTMVKDSVAGWPKQRAPRLFLSKKPRVGLLVPDGQAARTFMLSEVYQRLSAYSEILVFSPFDTLFTLDQTLTSEHIFQIPSPKRQPLETLLRYAAYRVSNSITHQNYVTNLNQAYAEAQTAGVVDKNLRIWALSERFNTVGLYRELYQFSLYVYASLNPLADARKALSRLKLSFVINANCISWITKLWTRAAAMQRIPLISNVVSWDNISTKWLIDEFAQLYLVWSEEMDRDFDASIPYFNGKRRTIVGSPLFEPIRQKKNLLDKSDFFAKFDLSTNKPLVLYTTGSKTTFPAEPDFLELMCAYWRRNLKDKMQIMVRMHPKDRSERYDVIKQRYPEIAFTYAGKTLQSDDQWVPSLDDMDLLVNQIHHADVIVNVASTMTLEGFAANKPSINIGFDMGKRISRHYPLRDYYRSRHYRTLIEQGAVYLADNQQDFYKMLSQALSSPNARSEAQAAVLRVKCADVDTASDKIIEAIANFQTSQSIFRFYSRYSPLNFS